MKKRFRESNLLLAIIFLLTIVLANVPVGIVSANSTTYYVDSAAGVDSNNGTSTNTPWKSLTKVNSTTFGPGDKILFKAGGSWIGQLHPLGSGASGSPIIIDMYGSGNKPSINGNRAVAETVYLYNQEYWEINNLDVVNDDNISNDVTDTSGGAKREGIHIVAENISDGVCSHIYVKNCNIHNVDGPNTKDTTNGGIIVEVKGTSISTKFDDILINNNTVTTVDWKGIMIFSTWKWRASTPAWNGSTNVVITNNYVDDACGDGICPSYSDHPICEYNYSQYSMKRDIGSYAVAIWPWYSENAQLRYNEACFTQTTRDGTAWDCDGGNNNTLYEFNYSHDNVGGCVLMAGNGGDYNNSPTFRYNISQNDTTCFLHIYGGPSSHNENIYNNTIYVASGKFQDFAITSTGTWPHDVYFKNNIYCNLGSGGGVASGFTSISGLVFDHNSFYGTITSSVTNLDVNKITSNPKLVNPGSGGTHIYMTDPNRLSGYKLQSTSPCINAGISISNNGGKDFWGTPLYNGAADIGACEYTGVVPTPTPTPIVTPTPTGTVSPTPTPGAGIAFDASYSGNSTAATSLSWNHTVGSGSNKMLIVAVNIEGTNVGISSVTYGGTALTFINSAQNTAAAYDKAALYYLANPTSGTYPVVVNTAASVGIIARSISLTNVYQGAPEQSATNNSNSATSLSTNITTTVGSWVVDSFCDSFSTNTNTAGTGQTNIYTGTSTGVCTAGSSIKVATSTTTTNSWTVASSAAKLAHVLASFKRAN